MAWADTEEDFAIFVFGDDEELAVAEHAIFDDLEFSFALRFGLKDSPAVAHDVKAPAEEGEEEDEINGELKEAAAFGVEGGGEWGVAGGDEGIGGGGWGGWGDGGW